MTGSMTADEVRQSMLELSWILEHLSACGDASPRALLSAWAQQATEALSASQSRWTGDGDVSTSATPMSSSAGSWEQLKLWNDKPRRGLRLLPTPDGPANGV